MRKAAAGALLLASALCAGTAGAQATAQVSVSDFSWALVDLDPNDGIDPSLTILPLEGWKVSSGSVTVNAGGELLAEANTGSAPFTGLAAPASAGNAFGSSSASPVGGLGDFALMSSAFLSSNGSESSLYAVASSGYLPFVLSPMTAVTFSSRVSMSLGLDLSGAVASGSMGSFAGLNVAANLGEFSQVWSDTASLASTGGPQSLDTELSLTVSNALGSSTRNYLELHSTIGSQVVAAPVPEPGTWAMFIGGLALLLAHARTRLRRQEAKARS